MGLREALQLGLKGRAVPTAGKQGQPASAVRPFGVWRGVEGGRAVKMQPSWPLVTLSESAELGIYFLTRPH